MYHILVPVSIRRHQPLESRSFRTLHLAVRHSRAQLPKHLLSTATRLFARVPIPPIGALIGSKVMSQLGFYVTRTVASTPLSRPGKLIRESPPRHFFRRRNKRAISGVFFPPAWRHVGTASDSADFAWRKKYLVTNGGAQFRCWQSAKGLLLSIAFFGAGIAGARKLFVEERVTQVDGEKN